MTGNVAMALGGLGLSAWEGTLWRSSTAAGTGVGVAITLVLAAAIVAWRRTSGLRRWGHRCHALRFPTTGIGTGATVWGALVAVTVGWDLTCFVVQRHSLPTLSRLCGDVTAHQWGRALFFAAWLLLGASLALGWRRRPCGFRPAAALPSSDRTPSDRTASDRTASDSTAAVDQ
jgi:hypothetical protein